MHYTQPSVGSQNRISMEALPLLTLNNLAEHLAESGIEAHVVGENASVRGMTIDSRTATTGCLFVCKGAAFKPAFLTSACESGAAAYLCDTQAETALVQAAPATPHVVVSDVRRAMALVAPLIYRNPDARLHITGITGTKGKSTTAYMLKAIFEAAGIAPSILGSIETDDGLERFESHNTTPEAPDLWRHLHNTVSSGRKHMIMEVSSQALKYDRVLGLNLSTACFLNMGRDHISANEHPSFEDYLNSKLRIFEQCETAVVNLDAAYAEDILAAAHTAPHLVAFSTQDESADYYAENVQTSPQGIHFDLVAEGARLPLFLGIAGTFNVSNALAAIAMSRLAGVSFEAIAQGLSHVRVPGRMELLASPDGRIVSIVDYAHNELSFETLFSSVQHEYPSRKIVALFGAPGGKAFERREQLPRVAGAYADLIIYTEEDPAHESVESICADLAAHTPASVAHEIICDREAAIARAFAAAQDCGEAGAVILLLAKGDETRQHRGDEYPEVKSDLTVARELMENLA